MRGRMFDLLERGVAEASSRTMFACACLTESGAQERTYAGCWLSRGGCLVRNESYWKQGCGGTNLCLPSNSGSSGNRAVAMVGCSAIRRGLGVGQHRTRSNNQRIHIHG